jgi:hypothetical protein
MDDESKSHQRFGRYILGIIHGLGSRQSMAGSGREISDEEECHAPRPGCRFMMAVASKDTPVHSVPEPTSLVHPFLPQGHQHFDGGLEETGLSSC